MNHRFAKLNTFLQARLSRESYLGLHLTLGALLLIGATWLFGSIAEDVVMDEPLTLLDLKLSAWLHAHARPTLTMVMLIITNIHSTAAVSALTTAFAIYLLWRGYRYWLISTLLTVFGGMLLNVVLKNVFHRARPHFDDPILTLSSYGFPSGHTMAATCFYGVLAAFAVWKIRTWSGRLVALALAVFLIVLVGFSRIYLGAHYLSDVLGAMAEGLAWLALCLTAVNTVSRARNYRSTKVSTKNALV